MINYLNGVCKFKLSPEKVILEVNGVGFGVSVLDNITDGEQISLFIYEHIREDTYDLYGFKTQPELMVFKQIISISGIGPKVGLSILKHGSISKLQTAVESNDVDYFESISGIGKKMAQKIIIELRSKINHETDLNTIYSEEKEDIKSALNTLGYKQSEYSKLLTQLPKEITTTESQLTWILKQLSKK